MAMEYTATFHEEENRRLTDVVTIESAGLRRRIGCFIIDFLLSCFGDKTMIVLKSTTLGTYPVRTNVCKIENKRGRL